MDPLIEAALSGKSREDLIELWKQQNSGEKSTTPEEEKARSVARLDLISALSIKAGEYSIAMAAEKELNRIQERNHGKKKTEKTEKVQPGKVYKIVK